MIWVDKLTQSWSLYESYYNPILFDDVLWYFVLKMFESTRLLTNEARVKVQSGGPNLCNLSCILFSYFLFDYQLFSSADPSCPVAQWHTVFASLPF